MNGQILKIEHQVGCAGPGLRSLITLAGCGLGCRCCPHRSGNGVCAREMSAEACAYTLLPYHRTLLYGGVTLACGGLWQQADFALELLALLKERGYHTALMTVGDYCAGEEAAVERLLRRTDTVIVEMQAVTEEGYHALGGSLTRVLAYLAFAEAAGCEIWLRMRILPGVNDREEVVLRLKRMTAHLTRLEKIELLPYRRADFPAQCACGEDCPDEIIERLQALVV